MKQTRMGSWLVLGVVLVVLLLQALHPAWSYHLKSDADGFYYSRAAYFLEHHSLAGLGYNEYQPGAVLFFLSLSPLLMVMDSRVLYVAGLLTVNMVLVVVLAWWYRRVMRHDWAVYIFAGLMLFTGPIVLYRFDLLVGLAVVLALGLWQKGWSVTSMLLLAVATLIKLYPAFLVPYLLLLAYRRERWSTALLYGLVFAVALWLLLGVYGVVLGVTPYQLLADLNIHALKPVHAESVWATGLGWWSRFTTGSFARGAGAYGIFGVAPEYVVGPLWFYNWAWVVPLVLLYIWLARRLKRRPVFEMTACVAIVLIFLVFSKILTPQYLLWALLLLPLVPDVVQFTSWGCLCWPQQRWLLF